MSFRPRVHPAHAVDGQKLSTDFNGGNDPRPKRIAGIQDVVEKFPGMVDETDLGARHDRILATVLAVKWRYDGTDHAFDDSYCDVKRLTVKQIATPRSLTRDDASKPGATWCMSAGPA